MEHYEVGDEVMDQFSQAGLNLNDRSLSWRRNAASHWRIDLKEINRRELIRLGFFAGDD